MHIKNESAKLQEYCSNTSYEMQKKKYERQNKAQHKVADTVLRLFLFSKDT